jgi:L-ribulokinase
VINAGGIPQKNDVLNQVYANVLGRPVLVPSKSVVSLGSAIFRVPGCRDFQIRRGSAVCPAYRTFQPQAPAQATYEKLYPLYNKLYFTLGQPGKNKDGLGEILPALIAVAQQAAS